MINKLREWLGQHDHVIVGITRRAELLYHTHGFQVRLYSDYREIAWSNGPFEEAVKVALFNSKAGLAEVVEKKIQGKPRRDDVEGRM